MKISLYHHLKYRISSLMNHNLFLSIPALPARVSYLHHPSKYAFPALPLYSELSPAPSDRPASLPLLCEFSVRHFRDLPAHFISAFTAFLFLLSVLLLQSANHARLSLVPNLRLCHARLTGSGDEFLNADFRFSACFSLLGHVIIQEFCRSFLTQISKN